MNWMGTPWDARYGHSLVVFPLSSMFLLMGGAALPQKTGSTALGSTQSYRYPPYSVSYGYQHNLLYDFLMSSDYGAGCQSSYLAVPPGWIIAPYDSYSQYVIQNYFVYADLIILADGCAYGTRRFYGANLKYACNFLLSSRSFYTTTGPGSGWGAGSNGGGPYTGTPGYMGISCSSQILIRCGFVYLCRVRNVCLSDSS
jgi:hypothetical protein